MPPASARRYSLALAALLLALGCCASAWAPEAAAIEPQLKSTFAVHQHGTGGHDWHVEVTVGKNPRMLKSVVLYLQECDRTAYAENVPVDASGFFKIGAPLKGGGGWRLLGRFVLPRKAIGFYELGTDSCASGRREFAAYPPGAGTRGNHTHHSYGTPLSQYPDLLSAPARALVQGERLRARTLAAARTRRFRSYAAVRRQYAPTGRHRPRPLLFHVHRAAYFRDGRVLDPRRPESLVYWWPRRGAPILVAFMYRAETSKPPRYAREVLGWHSHAKGTPPMTHVWLTRGLRGAAANCLPVAELQRDVRRFRYVRPAHAAGAESMPCRSSAHDHSTHHHDDNHRH